MAVTLDKVVSFNLSNVISGAVQSVQAERLSVRSRKEADFQIAVAEGTMDFAAQLAFREKQLADEMASGSADTDYIASLKISVGDIKKQMRFQKIRDKYKASLAQYADGKGNLTQTIDILKEALGNEVDPTIRAELQSQLTTALSSRTNLEREAIQNRITIAEKDKSIELFDKSIKEVKAQKAQALLAGDEDTASMWDATLNSLESQKEVIEIETDVADMNYAIAKGGLTSGQKMGLIQSAIDKASARGAIVYNGVRYDSMKDFWQRQQSDYISTGYFEELKGELEAETNRIAQLSPFGQVPVERIVAVSDFYKSLASRSEFAPYAQQIEQQRVATVSSLAGEIQGAITSDLSTMADPNAAIEQQNALFDSLENATGVRLSRLSYSPTAAGGFGAVVRKGAETPATDPSRTGTLPTLDTKARPSPAPASPSPSVNDAGTITDSVTGRRFRKGGSGFYEEVFDDAPAAPAPRPQASPTIKPVPQPQVAGGEYTVGKGDTLGAIAASRGTTVDEILKKNPGITNPNLIKIGQKITF